MTLREAKQRVYRVLVDTLHNDLDENGAAWIYEDDPENAPKIEEAARTILRSLRRRV